MAAVKIDLSVDKDGGRKVCDLVVFEAVPRDVVLGDDIAVWYRVSSRYRPKSGDWIGLFQCGDDDDDDDNCCVIGSYLYISFQWAPKYPNVEKSIPRRRVVFNSEQIKVDEPSDCIYYRFLYMTTSMDKVVGCSNRFRVRLMMALPPTPSTPATGKSRRRRSKAERRKKKTQQVAADDTTPATSPATAADEDTTTSAAVAADDETLTIQSPPSPPVSTLMLDDDVQQGVTGCLQSTDSWLSSDHHHQQQQQQSADDAAGRYDDAVLSTLRSLERHVKSLVTLTRHHDNQQQQQSAGRHGDDDDEDDWNSLLVKAINDLTVALMTSLPRQQALQRQLCDMTSSQIQQSRDLMTSQSRDMEWMRGWLDEERRMRRDMMASQDLLQRTLIDCLSSANQQLLAGKETVTSCDKCSKSSHQHPVYGTQCQRPSTLTDQSLTDRLDHNDDNEGTRTTEKPVKTHNDADTPTTYSHSNQAGGKHSRCHVTSSQVNEVETTTCQLDVSRSDSATKHRQTASDSSTSDSQLATSSSAQRSNKSTSKQSSLDVSQHQPLAPICCCGCCPQMQSTAHQPVCQHEKCCPITLTQCPVMTDQCPLMSRRCCVERVPVRRGCNSCCCARWCMPCCDGKPLLAVMPCQSVLCCMPCQSQPASVSCDCCTRSASSRQSTDSQSTTASRTNKSKVKSTNHAKNKDKHATSPATPSSSAQPANADNVDRPQQQAAVSPEQSADSSISSHLPDIASELAHVTSTLCSKLMTNCQPKDMPSGSVVPSGDELCRLTDAIAAIELDVRAMSAALQRDNTNQPHQDTATAPGPRHNATARPRTNKTTAAVALLLPPTEMTITSNDSAASTNTSQTSQRPADTANRPAQKMTKDTKTYAAGTRVTATPGDKDIKQADYNKYALLPPASSRLPFRLATTPQTGAVVGPLTDDDKMRRTDVEDKNHTRYQTPEDGQYQPPPFTGIQNIIRQLESISSASANSAAVKPKHHHHQHQHQQQQQQVDATCRDVESQTGSTALKNAGTSPINVVHISSKQTQTSPKSSAKLHDDKNTTVKSRSLESQQQQQQQQVPASTAVMPLALPRSSGPVTTATHSAAIPLPSPLAAGGIDSDTTDNESAVPPQATVDRKRNQL